MDEAKQFLNTAAAIVKPYRVTSGKGFRLRGIDPADTHDLRSEDKEEARELLATGVRWLAAEQEKLYAQDRYSVLLIFQAMDAAGKDGTIRHVLSGINPQGCQVHSFKQPSQEELDHDFLWRHVRRLPERGRIGIHNRSWYEEVLVARVHEAVLGAQKLPRELVGKDLWKQRIADIAAFEDYLARQGTVVLKFYLHLSRGEQKRRFLARLDEPDKNWKFSPADVRERSFWPRYMEAYEEAIRGTATKAAPWYVVPADNKWFTRLVVAAAIVERIERLNLAWPTVDKTTRKELAEVRRKLAAEPD
jgi:PPK2 family polyphosphate:nucleotide phosphotransferase